MNLKTGSVIVSSCKTVIDIFYNFPYWIKSLYKLQLSNVFNRVLANLFDRKMVLLSILITKVDKTVNNMKVICNELNHQR